MARIRSVHPSICESEDMVDVPAEVERTFVRLWTHCDDEGRAKDNPRLIKAALYPLLDDMTAATVDEHLEELAKRDLIVRYEVDGVAYLAIPSWSRWQHPQKKRTSDIPAPPESTDLPLRDEGDSGRVVVADESGPVVGEGVGVGEGDEDHRPAEPSTALALVENPSALPYVRTVFDAWIISTGRTGRTQLDHKRKRLIANALKAYPLQDVLDAVEGWKRSKWHRGENPNGTLYNDLELLLRDAKHIEAFRDFQRHPPGEPVPERLKGIAKWLREETA